LDGSNEFTFEGEAFQILKLEFSPEDLEALSHWRFHHPHPHVQLKMEVVYLRSQKLENNQIQHLCGISKATFYSYLREYQGGGVEQLKALNFSRANASHLCDEIFFRLSLIVCFP
jgi:hypothetical protein